MTILQILKLHIALRSAHKLLRKFQKLGGGGGTPLEVGAL